jgi:hypothetical protein
VAGTELVLLVTGVVDVVVFGAGGAVVVVVAGRVVVVVAGAVVDDVTLVDGICVVEVLAGAPGVLGSAPAVGMLRAETDTSTETTTIRRPKSARVNAMGACRNRSGGPTTRPLPVVPAAGPMANGVETPALPAAEPSGASRQVLNWGRENVRICGSGIAAPGRTATCLRHTLFDGPEEMLKQT